MYVCVYSCMYVVSVQSLLFLLCGFHAIIYASHLFATHILTLFLLACLCIIVVVAAAIRWLTTHLSVGGRCYKYAWTYLILVQNKF